jgi:hypothetical protein
MQDIGVPASTVSRGSGSGTQPQGDPKTDLAPYVPTPGNPWDARKAAHLMRRAGFGAKPDEIGAILQLGVDRTIDVLLTPSTDGLQEYGGAVLPHGEFLDLTSSLDSQVALWLYEMVAGRFPLKEKMALFWHDHFSVGVEAPNAVPLMTAHVNIFRRHGLGSFRQMLLDVTMDPAMQLWLDNYLNGRLVGGVPRINENYGRELLELYTMGVNGGYTQNDVVELSKVLSGWALSGMNQFAYVSAWHVTGTKTLLGKTIPALGQQELPYALDHAILPWPATAEYIVGKIWKYFVSEVPYPALITELANRFRADGFDLRSLMSTILRSNYFFSDTAIHQLVKSPVEYVIGSIRNSDTPVTLYRALNAQLTAMGYPLLRYGNPSGLEDGTAWIDSATLISRANYANVLTQVSTTNLIRARFDPTRQILLHGLKTAEQIVDHYVKILVGASIERSVRDSLVRFMNYNDTGYAPFTLTPAVVNVKVRGLVHLILSLPEYQLN